MDEEKLASFIEYASKLKGYEKGEAQLFGRVRILLNRHSEIH
jgi:hypothetical protein